MANRNLVPPAEAPEQINRTFFTGRPEVCFSLPSVQWPRMVSCQGLSLQLFKFFGAQKHKISGHKSQVFKECELHVPASFSEAVGEHRAGAYSLVLVGWWERTGVRLICWL